MAAFDSLGSRMIQQFTAIWKFRHFLMALIKLDLRLRYRRSVFGIGWSLLNPILMTIVLCLVFSGVLGQGDWQTYATSLLAGLAVWNFLRDSALQGCRSLINNESYIRQSPLPYGLYPLRTVAGQAIHFGIAMVVVLGMCMLFLPHSIYLLKVVPFVIPGLIMAFLFAWAVATITSFANVYFQDTQHLLDVGAQITFWMTPIVYRPETLASKPHLAWLLDANPVNIYLGLIRQPLIVGAPPSLELFGVGFVVTACFVGMACGTVAWLQKRVIFHM